MESFAKDPDSFMRSRGLDPDKYAQEKIAKRLEREMMTDEQREFADTKAKLMALEREKQEREEGEKLTRAQAEEQKFALQARKEMMEAWQTSGLPADAKFGAWIAGTMAQANKQDLGWTWDQCAAKVKEDWLGHIADVAKSLGPERLHELVGDGLLKQWREHDVKRVTAQAANKAQPAKSSPAASAASNKKRPLNEKSWDKAWDAL